MILDCYGFIMLILSRHQNDIKLHKRRRRRKDWIFRWWWTIYEIDAIYQWTERIGNLWYIHRLRYPWYIFCSVVCVSIRRYQIILYATHWLNAIRIPHVFHTMYISLNVFFFFYFIFSFLSSLFLRIFYYFSYEQLPKSIL